jgi:hypothetical protein
MRKVFKTRHFTRWMRKTGLADTALCAAVDGERSFAGDMT